MRLTLIVILPFALMVAISESIEYAHLRGAGDAPVVEGLVVQRLETTRWGGIPAGLLMIELVDREAVVIARTNRQALETLPDRVRFQYTGDPQREVFIHGEENPFFAAAFMGLVSLGIVFGVIVPFFVPIFQGSPPIPEGIHFFSKREESPPE